MLAERLEEFRAPESFAQKYGMSIDD